MPTQPNRNIQRLTLHVGVGTLASALSNAFAAILALRFLIRPRAALPTTPLSKPAAWKSYLPAASKVAQLSALAALSS